MGGIEVTVLGGGIIGLATAWACQRRGARVLLVERRHPGAGASGGVMGALAPHVPEQWNATKAFQLDCLLAAGGWWADVAAVGGVDPGYARDGRLQPLADDSAVALARARVAGSKAHWRGAAEWRVAPAADFAFAPASPTGLVVHDTLSARIHPARAVAALAAAIRARGGEIVVGAGAPLAGTVIHATGWEGLAELSQALGREVGAPVKGQAAVLAHDARGAPQIFANGIFVVPHADGTTAVGSTSERDFADPFATDGALDDVIARARVLCPALAAAPVLRRWAGLRPRARSRAPMLGRWPGREGHFIANGGFRIGFGIAPGVAEVMADLVLEGRDRIPPGFTVEDSLGPA